MQPLPPGLEEKQEASYLFWLTSRFEIYYNRDAAIIRQINLNKIDHDELLKELPVTSQLSDLLKKVEKYELALKWLAYHADPDKLTGKFAIEHCKRAFEND